MPAFPFLTDIKICEGERLPATWTIPEPLMIGCPLLSISLRLVQSGGLKPTSNKILADL
jgi:hypothetical protein